MQHPWARRIVVDDLGQQRDCTAAKGAFACQQFKQDRPQRVNVRPAVRGMSLAPGLFWRHVGRRTEDLARGNCRILVGFALCETEVHQERSPVPTEKNTAWLQIAVDDSAFVFHMQSAGNPDGQLDCFTYRRPLGSLPGGECLTVAKTQVAVARSAGDIARGEFVDDFNCIAAMRTVDMHGRALSQDAKCVRDALTLPRRRRGIDEETTSTGSAMHQQVIVSRHADGVRSDQCAALSDRQNCYDDRSGPPPSQPARLRTYPPLYMRRQNRHHETAVRASPCFSMWINRRSCPPLDFFSVRSEE